MITHTIIEAAYLKYTGLSKGPLGGWDYTVTELGTLELPGDTHIDPAERAIRTKFPKVNRFRIFGVHHDGKREWWFSGYC